ncbi:hypothetical protein MFIFM68171_01738 [Madurella fahalii]|uniref:NACHT domain-containing protein n=1 Tax=Madurella fahalii TaxID=1157608 RepID=A0ABQ0G189_9PEZI
MPPRSFLQKLFHRRSDAKQKQGGHNVQTVAAVSPSAPPARKDVSQITAASTGVLQPAPLPEPTFQRQTHTTASTDAPLLSAAPATDPADVETSDVTGNTAASLPVRLWDRAYEDLKREETALVGAYEKILSGQLGDGLGSTVTESQPNTIAQNDPDARRRQMMQIIHAGLEKTEKEASVKKKVGVAVDGVLSVKSVISLAVQTVPQAALAWTGICVVLEALANPIAATEANRKGINYVVKRMDWYWSLSGTLLKDLPDHASELSGIRHELENQIVRLYKALLSYQIKSVYSYYRNRGLVLLRDMIKLDDWNASLEAIQDAEKCFRDDTDVYTVQQVISYLKQLLNHATHQKAEQMSEKDQQCLKHLRLTDPRDDMARIERTKGGLLQDSYRWVLDNPDFQRWRDHPDHRLLWIKGDPGKGKTMLLCGIIHELDRGSTPASARHCNLAYFFCQATDSRINNATAVLRGLIYLLIEQQPPLLSHVRSEYDRAGQTLFKDANTWDALSRVFTNILRDPNLKTTYLVIDALDECLTDLPQLLDLIAQKSSAFPRVKSSESHSVKWIVSSRNWPQIEERLETAAQKARLSLELNAESVAAAVNTYIRHKVDQLAQLKKYDSKMRDAVQDHLYSHANGTFLWVALVCQALADPNVRKWHSPAKLREFPRGLDSLYVRMLEHIRRSEDADLCEQILAVATVVHRPISLDELTSLVEIPDYVSDDPKSLEEIIQLCGSFLTLRERTIYFVHQSAKDFLLGKSSEKASNQASQKSFDWVFSLGMEDMNRLIFSKSLTAMSIILRRDMYGLGAPGFPIDNVRVPDPDPLATVRYSCVYWVDHLCHSISGANTKRDDLLQDDRAVYTFFKTKYLYWLEALSLLRAVSEGVIAMRQLEGLLVSIRLIPHKELI